MASPLVARALKGCLFKSTRTLDSVLLPHRFFKITGPIASRDAVTGLRHASLASRLAPQEEELSQESLPTFDTLEGAVDKGILRAVKGMKITTMSPVQAQVFPLLPELARPYDPQEPTTAPPRDLLVKARTGTGKTLGFLIPAVQARLESIAAHGRQAARDAGKVGDLNFERKAASKFARDTVGTLIISPTRELATQIASEAVRLTNNLDGLNSDFNVRLFVGGENKRRQVHQFLKYRRDVVVATPGRLRDVLSSEPILKTAISQAQVLVLDEADTLLDMGFRPDINAIEKELTPKPERQTFLFSATVSRGIQDIAREMLSPNHKFINCVAKDASPVHSHVPQYTTILSEASEQVPHVLRLIAHDQLSNPGDSKIIIFLPTTKMTQLFTAVLRGLRTTLPAHNQTHVYEIHSKKTMENRTKASSLFRSDKSGASILISSDVSARGVDYPGVTRVIQVGVPDSPDQYIHRVGRTGRAGTKGRGDMVLLPFEKDFLRNLSQVPLQQLSTTQLTSEVLELAKVHDSDPTAFFPDVPEFPVSHNSRNGPSMLFAPEVAPLLEEINSAVENFKAQVDPEAVKETFMSVLGFYSARLSLVGTSMEQVVKSLQDWTIDAFGVSRAPYVSERVLVRMTSGVKKNPSGRPGPYAQGYFHREQGVGSYRSRNGESHSGSYRMRDHIHDESPGFRSGYNRTGESSAYRTFRSHDENSGYRPFRDRDQSQSYNHHRHGHSQPHWMNRGSSR